jgi:hypothetical protein
MVVGKGGNVVVREWTWRVLWLPVWGGVGCLGGGLVVWNHGCGERSLEGWG